MEIDRVAHSKKVVHSASGRGGKCMNLPSGKMVMDEAWLQLTTNASERTENKKHAFYSQNLFR